MPDKQTDDRNHEENPPFNDFDLDMNTTHLISNVPPHKQAHLIEEIEVKPSEQRRIALGSFTEDNPPNGFSTEITPEPNPAGSVLTEITSLGTSERYRLVLHAANYGVKNVSIKVWSL